MLILNTCFFSNDRRRSGKQYTLRFEEMTQVQAVEMGGSNLASVPIRRQDMNNELPPTWAHQHLPVQVEAVPAASSDFHRVQKILCERQGVTSYKENHTTCMIFLCGTVQCWRSKDRELGKDPKQGIIQTVRNRAGHRHRKARRLRTERTILISRHEKVSTALDREQ